MKGFTGASLLLVVVGLASIVHAEEAKANNMNGANMANTANMAAMPNMANMQQVVALTEKGPHGGWRAHGGHFRHRGLGIGRGGSGVAAGATCGADETKCGEYCADLDTNKNFCGSCDNECPWEASCYEGECYCEEEYNCQLGDKCVNRLTDNNACGQSCQTAAPCDYPKVCSAGHCSCPDPDYPDFCAWEAGIVAHCVDKKTDADNCGACNKPCPQPDLSLINLGFDFGYCNNGQCGCYGNFKICVGTAAFGDICVDYLTNENFCGTSCEDAVVCGEGSTCVNGKCSNECDGVTCLATPQGPAKCAIGSGFDCYCGITPTGPNFCVANFDKVDCTLDVACNTDADCDPGSICFTNVCAPECNVNLGSLGVCRPVDDACNNYVA